MDNKPTALFLFKHLPPVQKANPAHEKLGGKSARTKYIRSLTPRGFAQAVFESNAYPVLRRTNEEVNP